MSLIPVREYASATDPEAAMRAAYLERRARFAAAPCFKEAEVVKQPEPPEEPQTFWTIEETSRLQTMISQRMTSREIAAEMGRTRASITGKAVSLGLRCEPEPRVKVKVEVEKPLVRDWLKVTVEEQEPLRASRKAILAAVSKVTGVPLEDIRGPRRLGRIVHARLIAYLALKRHTQLSLPQIGLSVGRRDHTTVLHGVRSIEGRARKDTAIAAEIAMVTAEINASAVEAVPEPMEAA